MRKSRTVLVTIVGAAGLTACYDGHTGTVYKSQYTRNSYRSLDECKRAWGNDINNCVARSGTSGSYYGPYHTAGTTGNGGAFIFYGYNSNGTVAGTAFRKTGTGGTARVTSLPSMNGRFATSATARGGFGASAKGSIGG